MIHARRHTARISFFSSTCSTWPRSAPRFSTRPSIPITAYWPCRPTSRGRFSMRYSGCSAVWRKDREDRGVAQHRDAVVAPQPRGHHATVQPEDRRKLRPMKADPFRDAGEQGDLGAVNHDPSMTGRSGFGKRRRETRLPRLRPAGSMPQPSPRKPPTCATSRAPAAPSSTPSTACARRRTRSPPRPRCACSRTAATRSTRRSPPRCCSGSASRR